MKTPTARKLPSGQWFCRIRIDGQDIGITRPTEKEAVAEAMAVKAGIIKAKATPRSSLTLTKAIDDYISSRENVLSPSTIAGYRVIQRNRFPQLMNSKVSDIDKQRWQKAVNLEAKSVSAKTLKNSAMFVQTILSEYGGDRITAKLPQVVQNDLPWLTPDQIDVFTRAIRGNKYEIPMLLALSSLRQSEIIALKRKDIDLEKGEIHVNGAAVKADDGRTVFKNTNKNSTSRRTVHFLIPQLRQAVQEKERDPDAYIYPHYSNVLRLNINRICAANNLPQVGVHGLRRSFASLCYHLGIKEAVVMESGGWSELRTMRKIYTKISPDDFKQEAAIFDAFFKNGNENGNEK